MDTNPLFFDLHVPWSDPAALIPTGISSILLALLLICWIRPLVRFMGQSKPLHLVTVSFVGLIVVSFFAIAILQSYFGAALYRKFHRIKSAPDEATTIFMPVHLSWLLGTLAAAAFFLIRKLHKGPEASQRTEPRP